VADAMSKTLLLNSAIHFFKRSGLIPIQYPNGYQTSTKMFPYGYLVNLDG
jgi:hypothetical protein